MRARLLVLGLWAASCGRTDFFGAPAAVTPALVAVCGDGVLQPGEECEDGNLADNDGCHSDCTPAFCGDGVVFVGAELCDDGNTVSGDGCEPDCALPRCGDRVVQGPDETCDDGNTDDADDCLSSCLLAFCGDGSVHRTREQCDDANALDNDACVRCRDAFCGDGFVRAGVEACDDANAVDGDACTNACRLPVCGDGIVSDGEGCDRGPDNADRPALAVRQGSVTRGVTPKVGLIDVAAYYDYRSASSHMGIEQAREGRLHLYLDRPRRQLFLILNYGADDPGTQPESSVTVTVSGVPPSAETRVADDRLEEFDGRSGAFQGNFNFDNNTDGGAIGPLPYPGDWSIQIRHEAVEGIDRLVYVSGDGSRVTLDPRQVVFLEALQRPSVCRTDCRVPSCGDGTLDAGELCDEASRTCGNTCGQ